MGKCVIKGIFSLLMELDKTIFQDSELQEFIKSKIGKKRIYDNKFGFAILSRNRIQIPGDIYQKAKYMFTSNSVETKSGVAYEVYLYLDKDGNAFMMEIESAATGRSINIDV
jgi:hypothetical protein